MDILSGGSGGSAGAAMRSDYGDAFGDDVYADDVPHAQRGYGYGYGYGYGGGGDGGGGGDARNVAPQRIAKRRRREQKVKLLRNEDVCIYFTSSVTNSFFFC